MKRSLREEQLTAKKDKAVAEKVIIILLSLLSDI